MGESIERPPQIGGCILYISKPLTHTPGTAHLTLLTTSPPPLTSSSLLTVSRHWGILCRKVEVVGEAWSSLASFTNSATEINPGILWRCAAYSLRRYMAFFSLHHLFFLILPQRLCVQQVEFHAVYMCVGVTLSGTTDVVCTARRV